MNQPKTLLVLAGVKGAGKSTLLFSCLKDGTKLFGERLNPVFQSFTPHERPGIDKKASVEEALQGNFWLNDRHVQQMTIAVLGSKNRLIHMDLMARIQLNSQSLAFWNDKDRDFYAQRFAESTGDIFKAFDVVAVNTVYAPIEVCSERFVKRRARSATASELYNPNNLATGVFENIYAGWQKYLLNVNVSETYVTTWFGENFKITVTIQTGL